MYDAQYKKLSLLLKRYCPDFVVEKHPGFVNFLRAYYDWSMNKDGFNPAWVISHLIEWSYIDETIDEFIDYFKSEYLNHLTVDFNGDVRSFIKHTKEFYSSRGTPESFRFLLTMLSGNSGSIFYPNRYIMKSSDGLWTTNYNMFVENNEQIDSSFISTTLKGITTGSTGIIENIEVHFNYELQKQFIKVKLSNIKGSFEDEQVLFDNGSKQLILSVYDTVKKIDIRSRGNNYKVDDVISIPGDNTFLARVKTVLPGKIDSYAIFNGGSGYSIGDEITVQLGDVDLYYAAPRIFVDGVDQDGSITSLDIKYPGYGFYTVPVVENPDLDIQFISYGCGAIRDIEIITAAINYTDETPLSISTTDGKGAELFLLTGKILSSRPYYEKPGSFLSDEFKLQDSDYWQDYSYEIQSTLVLENNIIAQFAEYKDVFKKLVHPAGFKLFNSFVLSTHINMLLSYVNSTIQQHLPPSFVEITLIIEMISYYNRIIDIDRLWQHRLSTIADEENTQIGYYKHTGGEFVHSNIEISEL